MKSSPSRIWIRMMAMALCFSATGSSSAVFGAIPEIALNGIELMTPPDRVQIGDDTVSFRWRIPQELRENVRHYDITFWSTARIFRRRIPVQPEPGREEADWTTTTARSTFRKHGRYFWRVTAVDSPGYQTQSAIRSFVLPRPSLSRMFHAWFFPY